MIPRVESRIPGVESWGFDDPTADAADVFRAAMDALAQPGRVCAVAALLRPPAPLPRGIASLALALADCTTALWLDPTLVEIGQVRDYLRFYTGAPITADPGQSVFALVASPSEMPDISRFCQGTDEDPHRSTTILVAVTTIDTAGGATLFGPGIDSVRRLSASPLPINFWSSLRAQRADFPRGVDMFLATDTQLVGLPRTLHIEES
jgi:alpha-D-ribose 1-methylphosphonate 5-triphosphate synthase subunit PhnH